jgi:hypothetical protein
MHAVEFNTIVDGNTIHIPGEYSEFESQNVKVIIMIDSHNKKQGKRKPGTAKGKIFVSDDFDQPLNEAATKRFYQ